MERASQQLTDLMQTQERNIMGGERFTVTEKTFYYYNGQQKLQSFKVLNNQPFLPVAP